MIKWSDMIYENNAYILALPKQNLPLKGIAIQLDHSTSASQKCVINYGVLNELINSGSSSKIFWAATRSTALKYCTGQYKAIQI